MRLMFTGPAYTARFEDDLKTFLVGAAFLIIDISAGRMNTRQRNDSSFASVPGSPA